MNGGASATWHHADGRQERGRVRVSTVGLDWQADGATTRQIDPRRLGTLEVEGEQLVLVLASREHGQASSRLVIDDVGLLAPLHELRGSRANQTSTGVVADEGVATRSTPPPALLLVPAVLGLLLFGAWMLVQEAWRLVPADVERMLGESTHGQFVTAERRVEAPELQAWMEHMLGQLVDEGSELDWKLDIIEDPQPNAFALPGGFVVVHTGLLQHAGGPAEVAGVLAHEVVHVEQHHGLRQLVRSLGLWAGVSLVFGGGDLLVLGGRELLELSHSRDAESEADALAAVKLQRAGYSAQGLRDFLASLQAAGPKIPGVLDWLSTHPSSDDRVARLDALVAEESGPGRAWLDDPSAWDAAVSRLPGGSGSHADAPVDAPR